ncbi:hypothetical protein OOU_Y34scaffold00335g3 [Pyricularia oryzae Y34]|uniref:Uncharacterized protein n=1 Tax=Pyricularia oryzae (strain Y34) TaxID=1143189 RepID=A0AA97P2P5_PYRO3|nr:hypothetical protein OOU_Y34scaffold00335g3 [Pyricularia oryzae Y34]
MTNVTSTTPVKFTRTASAQSRVLPQDETPRPGTSLKTRIAIRLPFGWTTQPFPRPSAITYVDRKLKPGDRSFRPSARTASHQRQKDSERMNNPVGTMGDKDPIGHFRTSDPKACAKPTLHRA